MKPAEPETSTFSMGHRSGRGQGGGDRSYAHAGAEHVPDVDHRLVRGEPSVLLVGCTDDEEVAALQHLLQREQAIVDSDPRIGRQDLARLELQDAAELVAQALADVVAAALEGHAEDA